MWLLCSNHAPHIGLVCVISITSSCACVSCISSVREGLAGGGEPAFGLCAQRTKC